MTDARVIVVEVVDEKVLVEEAANQGVYFFEWYRLSGRGED